MDGTDRPKRRFPRIPSRTSILVRKLGGPLKGELSTTRMVGLGGCSFSHSHPLEPGEHLFLSILVGQMLVETRVRVVYSTPQPDGSFEAGVEFQEISPGHRSLIEGLVGPGQDQGEGAR